MTNAEAYVALNLLPGMGPVRVKRLLEAFQSPQMILASSSDSLQRVEGIGRELAETISHWENKVDLAHELNQIKKLGVTLVTLADADYPENLRNLYDPPLVLYVKGRFEAKDKKALSLIGSRSATYYGREMARKMGFQLTYAGFTVVSGLARGIDTASHEGALAAKGRTIAVLGCGIDQVYPPENRLLSEKIAESGAVISEFPIGTKPDRQTFPIRNRIVSGLGMGLVVIEAAKNSGALITARMALDQGRQVFAMPGRVDVPHSRGCHALIKQGAKLVESAEDVCADFEFFLPTPASEASPSPSDLSLEEQKIYEMLDQEPKPIDEIIENCGLPVATVSSTLLRLEVKKLAKSLPGKLFVKK
ncbi:MAG: DNA-processing protein DprA [Verrucomicrobiae bacterium]|nr:DNA-processing protein DprA [Verrucomicrobiae bacterium]